MLLLADREIFKPKPKILTTQDVEGWLSSYDSFMYPFILLGEWGPPENVIQAMEKTFPAPQNVQQHTEVIDMKEHEPFNNNPLC